MKDISRITSHYLIRGLGLGLAAASPLLYADARASKRLWPSTETQLLGVPSPQTRELTVAFPGIGSLGGMKQAEHIQRLIPAPAAYFDYSSDRMSLEHLARILRQETPDLKRVHISGHSMGGPLGLEVIRRAQIHGMKLGRIILFASPFELTDARNSNASKLLKAIWWQPGPTHKFVFQVIKGRLEGKSIRDSLRQAKQAATSGCSPRVWVSMCQLLEHIKLYRHMLAYANLVDEQTEAWYCMPDNPQNDATVYTVAASEKYREFFTSLSVPYRIWRIPGIGHAEVGRTCTFLSQTTDR